MRVSVDQERCCASGQCALAVPEVFDQSDDDGAVVLWDSEPPESLHEAVLEAEDVCPSRAITVRRET